MIKLSILIPTVKRHAAYLYQLLNDLNSQTWAYKDLIEILIDEHETDSIGVKRNRLLERARGKYLAFIDSDDKVSNKYISLLMNAIEGDFDCASLKGMYYVDGKQDGIFEHSVRYRSWKTTTNEVKYERFPNHLNLIKSSIAKQFRFPDKNFSEDFDWSTQIHNSGLLKIEYRIPKIIYHYNFITNKMKYSQSDEQLFIEDYFSDKPTGNFIDIGAYHITRFSNTRKLFEIGWRGILVEPAPMNYKAIAEHYKDEPRILVLNIAIGSRNGDIDFYESDGDAVSTSDLEHMHKWNAVGVKYTKIKVPQVSIEDFMNEYGQDCDFLNIDTEATNMNVFRSIPTWVFEQIKMICIEHDGCNEEIEDTLSAYGFNTLYLNAENIILAK